MREATRPSAQSFVGVFQKDDVLPIFILSIDLEQYRLDGQAALVEAVLHSHLIRIRRLRREIRIAAIGSIEVAQCREPLFHISSPLEGWNGPKPERHHHFIDVNDFPDCWRRKTITVEVEAKAKEAAVLKLKEELTLCMK